MDSAVIVSSPYMASSVSVISVFAVFHSPSSMVNVNVPFSSTVSPDFTSAPFNESKMVQVSVLSSIHEVITSLPINNWLFEMFTSSPHRTLISVLRT